MRTDILMCGLGGQGVLTMAGILGRAAIADGRFAKQCEEHGMARRGAGVLAHLRLADHPIASGLVSLGGAGIILSLEPLEGLRYLRFLAPDGALVTAAEPVRNIAGYPPLDELHARIRRMPGSTLVEAGRLAAESGDARALGAVMMGVASPRLPVAADAIERALRDAFAPMGEKVLAANLAAFRAGRAAGVLVPAGAG